MVKLKKCGSSFKNAFQGLKIAFAEEQSFQIQLVIAFVVIALMILLPLTRLERAILVLTIIFVLGLEILNSQIERIMDFLEPNHDPRVKRIKDLSSAAVLLATLGSVAIGLLILLPYLL